MTTTANAAGRMSGAGRSRKLRNALSAYSFIVPQILGYLVFVLGPLLAVLWYSLHSRNLLTGRNTWVGVGNYVAMFTKDPLFAKTLANSIVFTLGLVPANVVLSLMLSLLLAGSFRGRTLYRVLFFAPVVTSAVAWAIVWRFLLQGEGGFVNQGLLLFGLHGPNWLQEPTWAMVSVIATRVFKNLGMNLVIYLAAVMNLPAELTEAARIDGANNFSVLRRITIPLLMPTTIMVTVLTVIGSLKVFDHIMLLTAGGPSNSTMVAVYYIYYQAFQFFETGYASALAVILFLLVLTLTVVQWRLRERVSHYES